MKYPRNVYYRMRPGRFRVLRAVFAWELSRPYPPTVRGIGLRLDLSGACVHQHLMRLLDDGLIDGAKGKYFTSRAGRKYLRECRNQTV